jgi:glucosamine--fructose-6-phosphate aminotransferase (isomerizing)
MKHGPIALIDQFMPVVVIAPRCDATYDKLRSNIQVRQRPARRDAARAARRTWRARAHARTWAFARSSPPRLRALPPHPCSRLLRAPLPAPRASQEVLARRGSVIAITDSDNTDLDEECEYVIKIPSVSDFLSPILTVVPLQLLSYYIADMRGCNVDQPRNLAKSVTVE